MTGLSPYQIGLLAVAVQEAYHRDDGARLEELGHALLAEGRRLQGAARTVDSPDLEEQPAAVEVDG